MSSVFVQLNNPQWGFPLPLPQEGTVTHEPRAELIHEVNPAFLSYWNANGYGRAYYFWLFGFAGLISMSVLAFEHFSDLIQTDFWSNAEPMSSIDLLLMIIAGALPIFFAVCAYFSVRIPLPPPTYVSRALRRVYGWHGKQEMDGGWLFIEWDRVIPVIRQIRTFHSSGSSTLYVLQVLEVDPRTKAVTKTISLLTPQRDSDYCGEMWEYIRRYMNGAPEDLPPARIDWHPAGVWGLILRLREIAFDIWLRPDGRLQLNPVDYIIAPPLVASTYIFVGIGLWLEHIIPKRPAPAALEMANQWEGENPYPIHGASVEGRARMKAQALKVLPGNVVLMVISILFHLLIVGMLAFAP